MNQEQGGQESDEVSFSGYRQEFLTLLDRNLESLNRFSKSIARSEAREVMSETILRAYQGFPKLKDKQAFTSYLFTIATRVNREREKKAKRWTFLSSADEEAIPDANSLSTNAGEIAYDVEVLYRALGKLPVKLREAIVLFEIDGFSLEEIQRIQGGSLSGVKSRLLRARSKLSVMLGVGEHRKLSIPGPLFTHSSTVSSYHHKFAYSGKEKL